ncbi:MAG TPA: putative collagen-binding domain-containing protein, partial [Cyclobacteriaceae bacterium]|nr:putative collagen-binding domain-containing protein [Cyclobacteriaceae bacterium]
WQRSAKAAGQMQYLKRLMLSRQYFDRVDDQSLVVSDRGVNYPDLIVATRHEKGLYAFIYLPQNKPVSIDLSKLSGTTKAISWFDPRTGKTLSGLSTTTTGVMVFTPPNEGKDWILIIDDASQNFPKP